LNDFYLRSASIKKINNEQNETKVEYIKGCSHHGYSLPKIASYVDLKCFATRIFQFFLMYAFLRCSGLWRWDAVAIKKPDIKQRGNCIKREYNDQRVFIVKLFSFLTNVRYFIMRANVHCFSFLCPGHFLPFSRTSRGPISRICRIEHFRFADFTGFRIPIADPILSTAYEDFGSAYEVDEVKPSVRSVSSGPVGVLGAPWDLSVRDRTWDLKEVKLSEYNLTIRIGWKRSLLSRFRSNEGRRFASEVLLVDLRFQSENPKKVERFWHEIYSYTMISQASLSSDTNKNISINVCKILIFYQRYIYFIRMLKHLTFN